MYGRGSMDLSPARVVSIVGTRACTEYGERLTNQLVRELAHYDVTVVSGLALGIDTIAHRASLEHNIPTIGVLGHSLDRIYPASNRELVDRMMETGGVLSEFEFGTKPDRENFPQRNRIVAGMADVTVVIETKVKGGSMITAKLAHGYNRDVMAFPGGVDAPMSAGCNFLIKTNQASLIESIADLAYTMGWEKEEVRNQVAPQKQLFVDLEPAEQEVYDVFENQRKVTVDDISLLCGMPMSKTSALLLNLEFKGVVRSLPGKVYELA